MLSFAKAIAVIESLGKTWVNDSRTFADYYSSDMTITARQDKSNEFVLRLNNLKNQAAQIVRPPIAEARAAHDKYLQWLSKLTQAMNLLNAGMQSGRTLSSQQLPMLWPVPGALPTVQSGRTLSSQELLQLQALLDESTILQKQFYEQMDDLLAKYKLTRADVGL